MAKLTKAEARAHAQAMEYLQQDQLTEEQKDFVFTHFHEAAYHVNGAAGAFFTPLELAWDFALDAVYNDEQKQFRYLDMCAGIGVLSYCLLKRKPGEQVTCVEINPDYVAVGKKLVPEARWICGDITDLALQEQLGFFDCAYSNPPFGAVPSFKNKRGPHYSGQEAEYKVIDIASQLAKNGNFIIPQGSSGFKYSGHSSYERDETDKYKKFHAQTGIHLDLGLSIDTTAEGYGRWKTCNPRVEFVVAEFDEIERDQLDLFSAAG